MSDERRYTEDEVEEILERAADRSVARPARGASPDDGLTLGELQEIGEEVGIAPDLVADAASGLDRRAGEVQRTLGLPLSVRRTVLLPRQLTDAEWEQLVADLRTTFAARGKLEQHGRLRQWTNGNLHALLEPTPEGARLRMGTTKGSARQFLTMGTALLGVALLLLVIEVLQGGGNLRAVMMLATLGLGGLGVAAVQLPGWAGKRREQMDAIAERVRSTVRRLPAGEEERE